jgi:16S rRNA (cytidine1402-2'-O)-methyltransferase
MSGKLYIVATPIGNLGDITLRAIETLRTVDRIAAEDTRVTAKLLARLEIKKPMVSLRARSGMSAYERVVELVQGGEQVAYVTDAGTPGISDPGPLLVSLVREACGEAAIVAIPGPSALAAAVSVAGVPVDEFVFVGFLPHKKGRQKMLDALLKEERPAILYESPHRIRKLLVEIMSREPERGLVIAHELTKMHEHTAVGTAAGLLGRLGADIPERGEFVVVITP